MFLPQNRFSTNKIGVLGRVTSIKYDPNQNTFICLINFIDGKKNMYYTHEEDYEGELVEVGKFLSSLLRNASWWKEDFHQIRKKAFKLTSLEEGEEEEEYSNANRMQAKTENTRITISRPSRHMGYYSKAQGEILVQGIYKDLPFYLETYEECQLYSNVPHQDGLVLEMHKWMVEIMVMPMGLRQMKCLMLAREDLTNQVEGQGLRSKVTSMVCNLSLSMGKSQ